MKLLYIIPSFQHPNVRGPTRHYHFVRELSRRHEITLLVLNREEVGQEALDEVASYVDELHLFDIRGNKRPAMAEMAGRIPLAGKRLQQMLRLRDVLQRMTATSTRLRAEKSFDLVVFHGKSVFPVIANCDDLPIVVDFCDATSIRIRTKMRFASVAKRPLLWLRSAEIRRIEQSILNKTRHVAFISPRDREAILGQDAPAEILPNGVDHEFWHRKSEPSNKNCIVFTGVMDYAPNDDAAMFLIEHIAPRIRQSLPDLEVLIVGRSPTDTLQEAAARAPNVTVTGFVDDVRPYLERAAVFAAPLRYASGTQNKVLEALAMGVPTVTTSVVADGLRIDAADEPPVCIADGEAEFATETVRLLKDAQERAALATRGRAFVESHFVWSRSAERLEKMCLAALKTDRPTDEDT
jgi:glycosyltransferase involved in cell wall biosynthesis